MSEPEQNPLLPETSMTAALFPPKVAAFVNDYWSSSSHRRMFFLGQVVVKVAAMFQLSPDDGVPDDAKAVFILLLDGMESGDAATYARNESHAMALYNEWRVRRELH